LNFESNAKREHDKKAERNRKEKEKAFERLLGLPREQHEARLAELAKRLDEGLAAAIHLSRTPYEPSVGVQLLAALRAMFAKNRRQITSEQVVQELLADPNSQWHEYRCRGAITKNQLRHC
jgi:hypothetical protein